MRQQLYTSVDFFDNFEASYNSDGENSEETARKYIKSMFILGSVAEVERFWSITEYLLVDERTSMETVMF